MQSSPFPTMLTLRIRALLALWKRPPFCSLSLGLGWPKKLLLNILLSVLSVHCWESPARTRLIQQDWTVCIISSLRSSWLLLLTGLCVSFLCSRWLLLLTGLTSTQFLPPSSSNVFAVQLIPSSYRVFLIIAQPPPQKPEACFYGDGRESPGKAVAAGIPLLRAH